MNTIGIDIGKRVHVAAVCQAGKLEAERRILRFGADRSGFRELTSWLAHQGEVGQVVMESSGHYWMPLAGLLHRAGVPVAVVNPLEAKYFAKSRLQRTKSDPADARTLAALGMRDQPQTREPLAGAELREAARFAMMLVTEQARVSQRIVRLVDLGFPELGQVYDDPTCVSALAVLRAAPTARAAARKRVATIAGANRGPGQRAVGPAKAEQIQGEIRTAMSSGAPRPAGAAQPENTNWKERQETDHARYNAQHNKHMWNASGYINMGPFRAPYIDLPTHEAHEIEESMKKWMPFRDRFVKAAATK